MLWQCIARKKTALSVLMFCVALLLHTPKGIQSDQTPRVHLAVAMFYIIHRPVFNTGGRFLVAKCVHSKKCQAIMKQNDSGIPVNSHSFLIILIKLSTPAKFFPVSWCIPCQILPHTKNRMSLFSVMMNTYQHWLNKKWMLMLPGYFITIRYTHALSWPKLFVPRRAPV